MTTYNIRDRAGLFRSGQVGTEDVANSAISLIKLASDVTNYIDTAVANVQVDLTGYATETYVTTAISNLIDAAPTTLDTLNELAAALGDDANFATTVTTAIGLKLSTSDFDSTFDTRLATKTTSNLTEGSNLYYTDARVQTKLGSISGSIIPDTDISYDLGSATYRFRDLYLSGNTIYLDTLSLSDNSGTFAVVDSNSDPVPISLLANTTDDLAEGTNLYYTDTRVGTYLTTNNYATQSYVTTAISNLIDAAPAALDTLNELAAALGDDANFATSISTSLAAKADTSSLATVATSGSYNDLSDIPTLFSADYNDLINKPTIPDSTSDLTNDSGFITTSALTGYATETYVDTAVANVTVDLTGYATETYVDTAVSTKQDTLVSGTDIKTINGESILGSGDIVIVSAPEEYTVSTLAIAERLIDSFEISVYRSAEYFITTTSSDGYSAFKVMVLHDDTNVYYNTQSILGVDSGNITASITGTTVSVNFTPTNANTEVKFIRNVISVSPPVVLPLNLSSGSGEINLESGNSTIDLGA